MADSKWVIKFTDGTQTEFYGSLRTHDGVLYAERYGGFGGGPIDYRAFPLVNVKEWTRGTDAVTTGSTRAWPWFPVPGAERAVDGTNGAGEGEGDQGGLVKASEAPMEALR